MNVEQLRELCLSKPATTESFPFDSDTLVFKVAGKMFALISLEAGDRVNLKCDPDYAIELREEWDAVMPGYHMSKKHWNTVLIQDQLPDKLLTDLVQHSYDLVVASLPKKVRTEFGL